MGLSSGRLVVLDASKTNSIQSTASKIGLRGGGYTQPLRRLQLWLLPLLFVHSQTAFVWCFITFGTSEPQIIYVTAGMEREARDR